MSVRSLVVCESAVAVTTHLRVFSAVPDPTLRPLNYTGHPFPRPLALCGSEIAWDTKLPIGAARCRDCRRRSGLKEWLP